MEKKTKRKASCRRSIVEAKYKQGECTVGIAVSEEPIKDGNRYRIHVSLNTPEVGDLVPPILPQPIFWSWAFREGDLDALVYFLATELGYEVADSAPKAATAWVVWSDRDRVAIGWALGKSTGRVVMPRRTATRILSALAEVAGWELAA